MKKLRVGIIGLGVGKQHIAGYQSHHQCEVVALCDFSSGKLKVAHRKYPGLKIFREAGSILRDPGINVVSIASYDNYHYVQIVEAIKNNKHVFAEKPLCLFEKEARHIRRLLKSRPDIRLSSNLILRLSPRFKYLKKIVSSGKLGTLFYAEGDYNYGRLNKITQGWRGKLDFYSVVYGGGVHMVDLLLWLTNDIVTEVKAYGNHIASSGSRFKYDDMAVALLKFKSGLIAKVAVNFGCVYPHFHPLSIYGTKATFINGFKSGLLFKSRSLEDDPVKSKAEYPGVHKGGLIYSFIDSILGKAKAEVPAEDVFKAMSVCFAIEKSVKCKRAVTVKYI